MSCKEYVYSNDSIGLLIDYNYDIEEAKRRVNPDCVNILSSKYAVMYKQIDNMEAMSVGEYGYNSFPKLYGLLEDVSIKNNEIIMNVLTSSLEEEIGVDRLRRIEGFNLTGEDVIVGFVDTGINYLLDEFRREDGSSRIIGIWDQSYEGDIEESFFNYGRYISQEKIERNLQNYDMRIIRDEDTRIDDEMDGVEERENDDGVGEILVVDDIGHGTELAALCCGQIAYGTDILVVKLKEAKKSIKDYYGVPTNSVCYEESDVLAGILFLEEIARRENKPLVICISVGSSQGSHDGRTYVGELIDFLSNTPGIAVVVAGGNELNRGHHYKGMFSLGSVNSVENIELNIEEAPEEIKGIFMELWVEAPNNVSISMTSPTGEMSGRVENRGNNIEEIEFLFDGTKVFVDYVNRVVGSGNSLVLIRMKNPSVGIWTINVFKDIKVDGRFDVWLPIESIGGSNSRFNIPNPDTTLVSVATTLNSITVCGYDMRDNSLYQNSSRGYTFDNRVKPDIVAPAVDITTVNKRGDTVNVTGTSIASAVATGAVAMLYEWADYVI